MLQRLYKCKINVTIVIKDTPKKKKCTKWCRHWCSLYNKRWSKPWNTTKRQQVRWEHYLQTYHTFIRPLNRKVVALHVQDYRKWTILCTIFKIIQEGVLFPSAQNTHTHSHCTSQRQFFSPNQDPLSIRFIHSSYFEIVDPFSHAKDYLEKLAVQKGGLTARNKASFSSEDWCNKALFLFFIKSNIRKKTQKLQMHLKIEWKYKLSSSLRKNNTSTNEMMLGP